MAITTYSELQTAVANWLSRVDLTARIPEFITLAEAKFQRTLRTRQMETRVTASASEWLTLPTEFLELKTISITSTSPDVALEQVDPNYADWGWTSEADQPQFYALEGNAIRLIPAPDTTYTVQMVYYKKIPVLSATNTSNWLLADAPDVYLYGSVMEALIEVQDDARAQMCAQALARCLEELYRAERAQRWAGSPLKVRVVGATP